MKKKFYILAVLFLPLILGNLACPGPTATPTAPPPAPTNTVGPSSTFTPTSTGTISPTATPLCTSATDVTVNIDGADYLGNDTGKSTPAGLNLDQGGTATGDILTFTLASPMVLNFSLCPTEDINRALVMYIRSTCTSTTGETFNGGFCSGVAQITGLSLAAGTYYIILSEGSGSAGPGPYVLRIKSGTLSSTVCGPSSGVVPEAVPTTTFGSCLSVYQINGTPHNGTYGAPFSGSRAVTGILDESDTIANSDDFVSFISTNSGSVTVTMDCFDNGLGSNDFDIIGTTDCPTSGEPNIVGQSIGLTPTEQFIFTAVGGTTYYLDIQAYQGVGPYRVTIETP